MKKTIKLVAVVLALMMLSAFVFAACDKIDTKKTEACGEIDATLSELLKNNHYTLANEATLNSIATNAKDTINAATSAKDIDKAVADAKTQMNAVPAASDVDSYLELADYRAYMKYELANSLKTIKGGGVDATVLANAQAEHDKGVNAIDHAYTVADVRAAFNAANLAMANTVPLANGIFNFFTAGTEARTDILGKLESYAIGTGITGMTLYENGGLVMYSDRVTLGTENYIPNYGFGLLAEGSLKSPLATENNEAWKMYLHSYVAEDPGTANYLDGNTSSVSDVYGYFSNAFYEIFMNATKDGYDWVPSLAAADPVAVSPKADGTSKTWKLELRKGLKYSTLSSLADRAAFNDREMQLEDYITGYKLLMNYGNDYFRGEEQASKTGASAIVGLKEYYEATKSYYESLPEAEKSKGEGILSNDVVDFDKLVKIKVYEDGGKWWFEYELGDYVTPYNARYNINSSLTMPIPASFIALVGAKEYCGFSSDTRRSPVDNSLSIGAYTLERWDSERQIVFKKNPNYVFASTKYQIEGVHINVLAALQQDTEAAFKEFLAGKIDSSGIPSTQLEDYANDPRTRKTTGDTTMKINFNALNAEDWEYFFGENGVVSQSSREDYWEVEPALNNSHFRFALSYATDRVSFAAAKGCGSSVNFLSSAYMSDAENGVAYNLTKEHQDAVSVLIDDTDGNGYSLELARDYFRMALAELEAEGAYTPGTKENPTVITLSCMWWNAAMEEGYHKYIKQYWETAFNDDSVCDGKYVLRVEFELGGADINAAYDRLQNGRFDIGFGAITGMELNPLGFMSCLSTDQSMSGGFTLNWGVDTADPEARILVYKGMRWGYDALWKATDTTIHVVDGRYDPTFEPITLVSGDDEKLNKKVGQYVECEWNETETEITVNASITWPDVVEGVEIGDVVMYGFDLAIVMAGGTSTQAYTEFTVFEYLQGDVVYDEENRTASFTLVIPYSVFAHLYEGNIYLDLYCGYSIPDIDLEIDPGTFYDTWYILGA